MTVSSARDKSEQELNCPQVASSPISLPLFQGVRVACLLAVHACSFSMRCLLVRETNKHAPAQFIALVATSGFGHYLRSVGWRRALLTIQKHGYRSTPLPISDYSGR
jgi:hypothetical protein